MRLEVTGSRANWNSGFRSIGARVSSLHSPAPSYSHSDVSDSWHAVHHSFEAAKAALFALCHCKLGIHQSFSSVNEVQSMLHQFPLLFEAVAERWPVAIECKHEFERLLEPVWDEFISFTTLQHSQSVSPNSSFPGGGGGGAGGKDSTNMDLFGWDSSVVVDSVFDLSAFTALPFDVASVVPQDWLEEFDFQSFDCM
jgi:hypothetical protein